MIIFYTKDIVENIAILKDEEARHCSKVLRHRVGDIIVFIDGEGKFYESKLIDISKKECKLKIFKDWEGYKPDYELTIAISLVKNTARFDWFLEKVVEIGVTEIVPLICERTQKRNIKEKRMENIIISASKQSLKSSFPELHKPLKYKDFVKDLKGESAFIAHLNDYSEYFGEIVAPRSKITIIIGPEGDFTEEELSFAFDNGLKPVTLGKSRLRTETAGVVSCQIINTINEISS